MRREVYDAPYPQLAEWCETGISPLAWMRTVAPMWAICRSTICRVNGTCLEGSR